jgi:hypothetical protein
VTRLVEKRRVKGLVSLSLFKIHSSPFNLHSSFHPLSEGRNRDSLKFDIPLSLGRINVCKEQKNGSSSSWGAWPFICTKPAQGAFQVEIVPFAFWDRSRTKCPDSGQVTAKARFAESR